jgi:integrase
MAQRNLLTALQVKSLKAGVHKDGGNLFLRVRKTGTRSWVFRYKVESKATEIGLGATHVCTLADARGKAELGRKALDQGRDPRPAMNPEATQVGTTFEAYAKQLIEAKTPGWRDGSKTAAQWLSSLEAYVFPLIGSKRPAEVSLDNVKTILEPIWEKKTETATRVRQRVEATLAYAAVIERDDRRNVAAWENNLSFILAAPRKIAPHINHASLSYGKLPALMAGLRTKPFTSSHCLRFLILTAARSGEARGARWSEIDLAAGVWTVPASRIKAGVEHKVPLTGEALAILTLMASQRLNDNELVFPGPVGVLSDVALNKALHTFETGVTVHGMRSSFRQWGAECTEYPPHVLELALAHGDANKVQAAYQRSKLVDIRRKLMVDWDNYLAN